MAFIARDDKARLFCYVNGTVRKDTQNDEVLRFAAYWKQHSGAWPCELIFDSRLTTYANLARIDALGIRFITLRRRAPRILEAIGAVPREGWKRITLNNVARAYRNPRILEQTVSLSGYAGSVRQIAITGLGQDKPTLLITNQFDETPTRLVDRYACRMVIENAIAEAIDMFHMDALSAAVPLNFDVDPQLTIIAATLYRMLANRVGLGHKNHTPRTLFRKFVHAMADVIVDEATITVCYGRRANNPFLVRNGFADTECLIPWLGNRKLRLLFGDKPPQVVTPRNALGIQARTTETNNLNQ